MKKKIKELRGCSLFFGALSNDEVFMNKINEIIKIVNTLVDESSKEKTNISKHEKKD